MREMLNEKTADLELTNEERLELYRLVARARALEEALILRRREIPGPLLTGMGQEAIAIGSLYALLKCGILDTSIKSPDHRAMYGAAVVIDVKCGDENAGLVKDLIRNYFVRADGGNHGRDGNVHWGDLKQRLIPFMCSDMSVPQMVAIGFAEECARREWPTMPQDKRPVGVVYFGDGAAQQGIVHEGMNWVATANAAGRAAPMIFIINENNRACFTEPKEEYGLSELVKRADGYGGMVGVDVFGFDPEAMYQETILAIRRAQNLQSTLIVAHNFRLTGHNEDQIIRTKGALERDNFFAVEEVFGLDDKGLLAFRNAVANEPVFGAWRATLLENRVATRETFDEIVADERKKMRALLDDVLTEPKVTVDGDKKRDRSVFPPFSFTSPEEKPRGSAAGTRMSYNKAFAWIVGKLLKEDERAVYYGEDIANSRGGVLALSKGVFTEFPSRVWNTPISEEAIVATAAGRALAGGKPMFEFQFAPFDKDAFRTLAHVVAPNWYLKKLVFDIVAVYPCGVVHGGGSGHFHESWPERFLLPMEGIVVVVPSNAHDVVGLMRAAHEYGGPVAVLLQIAAASLPDFYSEVPEEPFVIPFGKARVAREGTDVSVITYGAACVSAAKNEAEELSKEGISLEVIDLRTVHPLDTAAILLSVAKTGRCLVFHEDYFVGGVGDMLVGALSRTDGFLEHIKTRRVPVIGASTPFIPTDLDLVWARLPYERATEKGAVRFRSRKLAAVARELMTYR